MNLWVGWYYTMMGLLHRDTLMIKKKIFDPKVPASTSSPEGFLSVKKNGCDIGLSTVIIILVYY